MPYIDQKTREILNEQINTLAELISQASFNERDIAGLLNYSCTTLAMKTVKKRCGRIRYWTIALVTGVFKNISDEFYRRVAVPYEDNKIDDNGDIDVYKEDNE